MLSPGKSIVRNIRTSIGAVIERIPRPKLDVLDQILGLRSWGLVLYGALPASLSLLGFLDIKDLKVPGVRAAIPILLVSLLPFLVTFLLVRAREREWYFTADYLNLRSGVTTLLIVLSATLISCAAEFIRTGYRFDNWVHIKSALSESFLFATASLVVSSTLFATILTKGADLPGLPSSGFVSPLGKVRQQLIAIRRNSIWREFPDDQETKAFDNVKAETDKLVKELKVALSQPGQRLAKLCLEPLESDLKSFTQSLITIKDGGGEREFRWQARFADFNKFQGKIPEDLKNERESIQVEYAVLQRIKCLRLGG